MTIYNLGSINIDHSYRLTHFPQPGETIASQAYTMGLGGKGANQSVAAARAGAKVVHIGALGDASNWIRTVLCDAGVIDTHITASTHPTGHAIILLDQTAENLIVLHEGANHALHLNDIENALTDAEAGDWFLLQNETNMAVESVALARAKGLKIAYSAAPFDAKTLAALLPQIDLLVLNEIEHQQAQTAISGFSDAIREKSLIVTKGSKGAVFTQLGTQINTPAIAVDPVDTTGAGDTFLGYVLAGLDAGIPIERTMQRAAAASALQVTRKGAIPAIPTQAEVVDFAARP